MASKSETKPIKNLSFVNKTIAAINSSDESYEDIGEAVGVSFQTVRRLAQGLTPKPNANTIQKIYEYLFECELQF